MKRTAQVRWQGDGKTGRGVLGTQSGALQELPYSFASRFVSEDGKMGTNPEELIAAAHAGCFSMALAFALSGAGHQPEQIETKGVVTIEQVGEGFQITAIALELKAKVPGIAPAKFQELAQGAKANCPVSRALSATPISLTATLL